MKGELSTLNRNFESENQLFYNPDLMKSVHFSEKYNASLSVIDVARHNGNKFVKKHFGVLYIDEKALIRRREFSIKVWNKCHENLFLITEHISENKLSEFLSKHFTGNTSAWNQFFMYGLFSPAFMEKSLFSYKINEKVWIFYRASTFIIRRLLRYEDFVSQGKMRRIKSGGLLRKA